MILLYVRIQWKITDRLHLGTMTHPTADLQEYRQEIFHRHRSTRESLLQDEEHRNCIEEQSSTLEQEFQMT